jgi:hypothetical protein
MDQAMVAATTATVNAFRLIRKTFVIIEIILFLGATRRREPTIRADTHIPASIQNALEERSTFMNAETCLKLGQSPLALGYHAVREVRYDLKTMQNKAKNRLIHRLLW